MTSSFSILSMMKDEGPRLLEWLAYHRLIGFDTIWVYTNDCRDGTDAMLDRLAAMGLCHHLRNVVPPGKKPQPHALTLAQKNAALLDTDWLLVLDADEFLHVKTGDGSVAALIDACPDGTTGVAVTWRIMGSEGREAWSDAPVLSQFRHGALPSFRRGWGVKTLFRPFDRVKLGIHRPSLRGAGRDPDLMMAQLGMPWVNGSGVPLPPGFLRDAWRSSAATLGYHLAEVAHFAVQSREAYRLRGDRGNVNLKQDKYDATYFAVYDRNEAALPALSRWSGPVAEQVADWMTDPTLARLHAASVAWHETRLVDLRRASDWAPGMQALRAAAGTTGEALDALFLDQPFPPRGRAIIDDMLSRGQDRALVTKAMRDAVLRSERARDLRDAEELRAMGITPAFEAGSDPV
jgi:hypothetical protein